MITRKMIVTTGIVMIVLNTVSMAILLDLGGARLQIPGQMKLEI